jgi:hypothetical protein
MTSTDELIIGRFYWVQFYRDGSWQLARWTQYGDFFDTSVVEYQDWSHPKPIRWVLIPLPEELCPSLKEGNDERDDGDNGA